MPPAPDLTTAPVEGWVQFRGDGEWSAARFALSRPGEAARLFVQPVGAADATEIDLVQVTSLDEIAGAPAGFQLVEIEVDRLPLAQGVWPEPFTTLAVDALLSTVPSDQAVPTRTGAFVSDRPEAHADRGQLRTALIGVLAVVGIAAMVLGALSLRNATSEPEPGSDVPTTTAVGADR